MPFISNVENYSEINSDVQATPGSLSSLLFAVLARIQGKSATGLTSHQAPSYTLEGSMSRISASEVKSLPSSRRTWRRPSQLESTSEDENIPARLLADTMPQVHNRLPDPSMWSKIQEDMDSAEVDTEMYTRKLSLNEENDGTKVEQRSKRSLAKNPSLEGILRRRQLYCKNGFHIQIMKNGDIKRTREDHDLNAILEVISVDVGVVTIRGVSSGNYLAMNSKGKLYGTDRYTKDCQFYEKYQKNHYNTYSSVSYSDNSGSHCLVSLGGRSRRARCRTNENVSLTHFLPRAVDPEKVQSLYQGILY